ncbi:hypothetical protein BAUCODRAFT_253087 [Baudoinia panamericana UAMH 10762]|uniref:Uncharacterized protein n=1 Tax=Baudoinia panamericana (strain UAMH 10762) TaxID=717646 RepID=M2N4N1_BAUPA|nr:uncharacterized protein BAUCODRAFT_253087 [Baudoinia panamericana UAMH 10762]EMC93690.1 hypothetical protein BAUCODRAFT_253087 [Baudoinia panamericana UAMH 10762]
MQHLPSDVLQELQCQGEREAQPRRSKDGAARQRRHSRTSAEDQTAIAFSASGSPPASRPASSPSASLVLTPSGSAPRGLPRQRLELPPEVARLRPGSGSRSPTPPPRSSATETVPSQLLGGCVGADADLLMSNARQCTPSPYAYHLARKTSVAARLHNLLASRRSSHVSSLSGDGPSSEQDKQSEKNNRDGSSADTPQSGKSRGTGISAASTISRASSFAYFLRNNRPDLRLFKKRSQPIEHLRERPDVPPKKPLTRRSSSYCRPRVVQDTAISSPPPTLPHLRQTLSLTALARERPPDWGRTPASKTTVPASDLPAPLVSLSVQQPAKSSLKTAPSTLPRTPPARPRLLKTPTLDDLSSSPRARQVRIETPGRARSRSRESGDRSQRRPGSLFLQMPPRSQPHLAAPTSHHDVTPPNVEPSSPDRSHFRHGESYFRTFGEDTVFMKEFTPTMIPSAVPSPQSMLTLPEPVTPLQPSMLAPSQPHRRRSLAFLHAFHRSTVVQGTHKAPHSGTERMRPPTAPGISVSPPDESPPTHGRSSMQSLPPNIALPAYFMPKHGKHRSQDSESSTGTTPISPLEPIPHRRPALHRRDMSQASSDSLAVSPMNRTRSRPRLRQRSTVADIEELELPAVLSGTSIVPAVTSEAVTRPQQPYRSSDGQTYYQTPLTGAGVVKSVSANHSTIRHPPEKQPGARDSGVRRSVFKNFFLDLRKTSMAAPVLREAESAEPEPMHRRQGLPHKASTSTFLTTMTSPPTNKLRKKSSVAMVAKPAAKPSPKLQYNTEVTNFYQTPYSQRVANTRRAEQLLIRSLVEDALNDSDADDVQLGYEQDVPDHLPSSPLCPLSPMHKSGGRGICPLHGWKRKEKQKPTLAMTRTGTETGMSMKKVQRVGTKLPEPVIVYEGKVEEVKRNKSGGSVGRADVSGRRQSGDAWYDDDDEE